MAEPIDVHKVFAEYFKDCEALAYAVSSRLGEGNMCLDIEVYLKTEDLALINPFFKDEDDFRNQFEEGTWVTHNNEGLKPFIIHKGKAYLHRYFKYETAIIKNIRRLGDNFHIVTGGPGSGKTYSVSTRLVELLRENPTLKIALAAPTGKAAARMNESIKKYAEDSKNNISETIKSVLTGSKAQTIHRLLGSKPDSVFFKYDETNRLPYDVVIIDECSMVDGAMMAKLLNAVDEKTVLILIGDKDQLASVEAGSVFGDICRARDSKLLEGRIELKKESHRFDPEKGIGKFSKQVIDGQLEDLKAYDNDEQIKFDPSFSEELFAKYAMLYIEYISESDIREALKKINLVRFLCVTRENKYSVAETNKRIQWILRKNIADKNADKKPEDKILFEPREGFYHNQPVIITKNDYKLGIFNGDVGLIRKEGETLYAWFATNEGEIKKIQAGFLNFYDPVFAMTIHKSQGSEFDHVVVIIPEKQGEKLLTRELLYTGVTRAISNVMIQSTEEVLLKCAAKSVSRASGLEERLKNE